MHIQQSAHRTALALLVAGTLCLVHIACSRNDSRSHGARNCNGLTDTPWWVLEYDHEEGIVATDIVPHGEGFLLLGRLGWHYHPGADTPAWIAELDSSGRIEWQRTLHSDNGVRIQSAVPLSDGSMVVAGYANSVLRRDLWIARLERLGQLVWQKKLGHPDLDEWGALMIHNRAGQSIIVGNQGYGFPGSEDGLVIAVDTDGHVLWQRVLESSDDVSIESLTESGNGDLILAGKRKFGFSTELWAARLDGAGELIWSTCVSGPQPMTGGLVAEFDDGSLLVAGSMEQAPDSAADDLIVVKLTGEGGEVWAASYGTDFEDYPTSVLTLPDGSSVFTVNGATQSGSWASLVALDDAGQLSRYLRFEYQQPNVLLHLSRAIVAPNGDLVVAGVADYYDIGADPDLDDHSRGWMVRVNDWASLSTDCRFVGHGDVPATGLVVSTAPCSFTVGPVDLNEGEGGVHSEVGSSTCACVCPGSSDP